MRYSNISLGHQRGFTLIEVVIVIVISGVLASVVAQFITRPVEAYTDLSRRGELVDIADSALQRMTNDIRKALPNSLRVACGGQCIEFLHQIDGGRYRAKPVGDILSFNPADNDGSFQVLSALPASVVGADLVVYNTGYTGTDAYAGLNRTAITGLAGDILSFDNNGGTFTFPAASPQQRFFVVDTPVTYLCTGNQVIRYQNYAIQLTQPTTSVGITALPGVNSAILVDKVGSCTFNYVPASPARNGLVTLELVVQSQNERVTLLQQAHVSNLP